jgi:hypothetical protein
MVNNWDYAVETATEISAPRVHNNYELRNIKLPALLQCASVNSDNKLWKRL